MRCVNASESIGNIEYTIQSCGLYDCFIFPISFPPTSLSSYDNTGFFIH